MGCSPSVVGDLYSGCAETTDSVSVCRHRLFWTSTTTNANLGGLTGADTFCSTRAASSGLTRTYKALLADSTTLVQEHVSITQGVSIAVSGSEIIVAQTSADFWDGTLAAAPNANQNGTPGTGLRVFTGFNEFGGVHSDAGATNYCNDWTDSSSGAFAPVGTPQTPGSWAETTNALYTCASLIRIYCISQP
jgi:hypothetical protein